MTNADKIRTMDDVELASLLVNVKIDGLLRNYEYPSTAFAWLEWLEKEAE